MIKFLNGQSKTVTSAAIILAGATLLNKFIGIARDRTLAHLFGAGPVIDAYYAAFKIPDLVYNLLVVGALTAGFIPIFTKIYRNGEGRELAWRLANNVLGVLGVALIILCAGGMILAPQLSGIIAPGFDESGRALVGNFTRIMFLSPLLLGLSMVAGGILQSLRRFVLYSLAPIFYNIGIIFGALALVPYFGTTALAWGVVLGAAAHCGLQFYGAYEAGWRFQWSFNLKDAETRVIAKLMVPRTLGLAVSSINTVVTTILASTLPLGSVAVYNYADNLQWVAIGTIGIPFALAVFPVLSASASEGAMDEFVKNFSATARKIIFLIIPLTLILMLLRAQIVRVILGSGEFDWSATIRTADALALFSLGLFAQALVPLLARGFYALQNTKTPFVIAVISALVNIITALVLMKPLGVAGLALAASVGAVVNMSLLAANLYQITKNLELDKLLALLWRLSIAALCMGSALQWLKYPLARIFNLQYFWGIFMQGFIAGIIGLAIYGVICYFLRVPEFMEIKASFARRWLRTANVPAEAVEGVEVKE